MLFQTLLTCTALLSSLSLSVAASPSSPDIRSIQIFYQPHHPQPARKPTSLSLATIEYNTTSLRGQTTKYTPPNTSSLATSPPDTSHPLYHLSLDPSTSRSTTLTSLASFRTTNLHAPTFVLHLNADHSVFAVSLAAAADSTDTSAAPKGTKGKADAPNVVLLAPQPGPTPRLNMKKPIVVDEEGREVEAVPEVEKTLFQRYWWVFAIVAALALTGGKGEEK